MIRNQSSRRNLKEASRAMLAAKLKKLLAAAARKRQATNIGEGKRQLPAKLQEGKGEASEEAAKMFNVSARSVQHAATVEENGADEIKARGADRGHGLPPAGLWGFPFSVLKLAGGGFFKVQHQGLKFSGQCLALGKIRRCLHPPGRFP